MARMGLLEEVYRLPMVPPRPRPREASSARSSRPGLAEAEGARA
jgi:hypothetical protein